jgi:NAD(P)-dependent dehydrogenase (short-subunit alcohol dehydrogenase family)
MNELENSVVVITGGTSGIGLATAQVLAHSGSNLVISARNPSPKVISKLAEATATKGAQCVFEAGDIRDESTSKRISDLAISKFGKIDAVVHSAGGGAPGTALDLSYEDWLDAFNVHVNSVFHLFRATHDALASSKGSMTLLSSAAALRGCPGSIAYQTVKAAVMQMARALARDHASEGIRVNCVAPGIIRTPFHADMPLDVKQNNMQNRIPLGREGTPEQVASLIQHLMTNEFITGETMVIDGGMSMRMV